MIVETQLGDESFHGRRIVEEAAGARLEEETIHLLCLDGATCLGRALDQADILNAVAAQEMGRCQAGDTGAHNDHVMRSDALLGAAIGVRDFAQADSSRVGLFVSSDSPRRRTCSASRRRANWTQRPMFRSSSAYAVTV